MREHAGRPQALTNRIAGTAYEGPSEADPRLLSALRWRVGVQEFQHGLIENLWSFKMRHVAQVRQQDEFAVRNTLRNMFGTLRKILSILVAADHQSSHLDFRP